MRKLNIILTAHDFVSPIRGGAGLLIVKAALELRKRGNHVKIMAPTDNKNINGIEIINLPHVSKDKPFILTASKYMLFFVFELFKIKKFDVIFTHGIAGIPAVIFGKIFNKKVIIDVTDLHTEYLKESPKKFPWKIFISIVSKLEYSSLIFATKVIVVSNVMKNILIKNGVDSSRLHVVYYVGFEVEKFSTEKQKKDYFTIIHHGGVDVQDGVNYIAEAAPLVLEKYPETKFMIVGGGACLDFVKEITKRKGVEKSFIFTGWKPYDEIMNYLKEADIGLVTRPNTLANNTVLPLKLLEYWASGTAAISSRLKGIQEVAEENDDIVFFEPDNPKDLAEKLINLLESPELVQKLQKKGRMKAIGKFNWEILVKEMAEIIEE
ncbi:MAG: glycosyltransferase family 4 protein [Candidatus Methanoperedens sp.]|nr:glycosyltransferase family 4 protein [Candidatus Methanoperedens sp.]